MPLSDHQHDILACAVNERLFEIGLDDELPYEADNGGEQSRPGTV